MSYPVSLPQAEATCRYASRQGILQFLSTVTYGLHADNNNGTADCHEYLGPMDSTKYPRGVSF